ncbi:hypothetical protein [Arthrobacter methylotrophus]
MRSSRQARLCNVPAIFPRIAGNTEPEILGKGRTGPSYGGPPTAL